MVVWGESEDGAGEPPLEAAAADGLTAMFAAAARGRRGGGGARELKLMF